jgi:hypothetical protein
VIPDQRELVFYAPVCFTKRGAAWVVPLGFARMTTTIAKERTKNKRHSKIEWGGDRVGMSMLSTPAMG